MNFAVTLQNRNEAQPGAAPPCFWEQWTVSPSGADSVTGDVILQCERPCGADPMMQCSGDTEKQTAAAEGCLSSPFASLCFYTFTWPEPLSTIFPCPPPPLLIPSHLHLLSTHTDQPPSLSTGCQGSSTIAQHYSCSSTVSPATHTDSQTGRKPSSQAARLRASQQNPTEPPTGGKQDHATFLWLHCSQVWKHADARGRSHRNIGLNVAGFASF